MPTTHVRTSGTGQIAYALAGTGRPVVVVVVVVVVQAIDDLAAPLRSTQ